MLQLLWNAMENTDDVLLTKIVKLDMEIQWLLDRLNPVVSLDTVVERESSNSSKLSEMYDDVACDNDLKTAIAEAFSTLFRNLGSNLPSLNALQEIISSGDTELNKERKALVETLNTLVAELSYMHPIAITAYVATLICKEKPWLQANAALARLSIYAGISNYYPEILSCSISETINFGNHHNFKSLEYTPLVHGVYSMLKLIYKAVCIEYIRQQIGRELTMGQLALINDFTGNSSNLGRINLLICTLKEVY